MSEDHVATFGLLLADNNVPWPERGSGGRSLTRRDGWERRTIPVMKRSVPSTMEAMCRGDLAVNVMLEGEGFAICLAASGYRLSYSGRVFAHCDAAMNAAEEMAAGTDRPWVAVQSQGLTARQRELLKTTTDDAEARGDILLDMVFPT